MTLPLRSRPRVVAVGVTTNTLALRDLVGEIPRPFAEGAVRLGDEAAVVNRQALLGNGVQVAAL